MDHVIRLHRTGASSAPSETATARPVSGRSDFWAVVLAGGEGLRLRPLLRRLLGEDRPKQYVKLLGPRTLLRQTLDRIAFCIPPERTLVVVQQQHAPYLAEESADGPEPHLLAQPSDRGTAVAVLYAARRIARRQPGATMTVFPSDHFVLGEATFMAYVAELGAWVDAHPDRLVLLGARATSPEVDYGWIEPGEALGDVSTGPVHAVRHFWEAPSPARARLCLGASHLWNTGVVVGKVATFLRVGRQALPVLSERLALLDRFAGMEEEPAAVRQGYDVLPASDLSRSVLAACPESLAVSRLPRLVWSDLGNPRRVMEVATRMRVRPAWADELGPLRDSLARVEAAE
jgi:mannose-1-phosphate guanylyltransferase